MEVTDQLESRANGWLRFLERKLNLREDDWSRSGTPSSAWDNMSGAPTTNWYRFDAVGVATTLALGSRVGRLECEVTGSMLDGIVDRLRKYHGFNEWVEQQGPDPQRSQYPPVWQGTLIPESLWGSYDSPGWASNGAQANGFEPNPIEAQGAIYYKGFFNYVLGLRTLVDPSLNGNEQIDIVYDDNWRFRYSHSEINSILTREFAKATTGRRDGLCCEIHKLWPL